jgi:hypothetical protein
VTKIVKYLTINGMDIMTLVPAFGAIIGAIVAVVVAAMYQQMKDDDF